MALPQREPVIVSSGKVADAERDHRKGRHLHGLALGEEALGDSTLIEHLEGA